MLYIQEINLNNKNVANQISTFLSEYKLKYTTVDYTLVAWYENAIVGVCSKYKNLIKNIAVDPNYSSFNVFTQLITKIRSKIFNEGYDNVFVITKKTNKVYFEGINLKQIYENDAIAFLCEKDDEYENYKSYVNKLELKNKVGLILLNANPLTLGHLYLINQSRKETDQTILIPVVDDSSFFTTSERIKIIESNIEEYEDVKLIKGTDFLISKTFFPSYFLSSDLETIKEESQLNAWIFNDIFSEQSKKVTITRYLGTEPYSATTNEYNSFIKNNLNNKINTKIIKRLSNDKNNIISASKVREAVYKHDIELIKTLVSEKTFDIINKQEFYDRASSHPELIFKNN